MTSRSIPSVRAIQSALIFLAIALFPVTAWLQEPAAVTPAQTQQAAVAGSPSPAAEQSGRYEIRKGDTLWDIANAFYRDPFLWPLIWKSNPSINDPDLIYPGTALVIPSLAPVERAMSAPEEAPVQEKAFEKTAPAVPGAVPTAAAAAAQEETGVPSVFRRRLVEAAEQEAPAPGRQLIMPEEADAPIIDKYAMLGAGFVSEESSQDYIQGAVEDASLRGHGGGSSVSYDQDVYIVVQSRETVNVGDRFLIFEEEHNVNHPVTGQNFGKLYKVNGVAKVTGAKDQGVYPARITLSFDAATKGNMLAPYQEPALIYPSKQKQAKNLTGYILEVTDRKSLSGEANFVFIDKGKEDGVEPGDRFTVMSEPNPLTGVSRQIGEVQVLIVKARTATAVVQKSVDALSKGYAIVFKN
jgi:LysM repeat protein